MIDVRRFEEVVQIRMSREIDGKPFYWVSAYLVDGLLIDTGCSHTSTELIDFLSDYQVDIVVNTHHHEDHVGGNAGLMNAAGRKLLAHPEAIPRIKNPGPLAAYRKFAWGKAQPSSPEELPAIIETSGHIFHVVETPGHCAGHVALVEKDRGWVFSGDLYSARKLRVAGLENDFNLMLESMLKLIFLECDRMTIFTAMRTVEHNGRLALRECVENMEELRDRIISLSESGLSVPAIVNEIWGRESVFASQTQGEFSSENLVRNILETTSEKAKGE
jgi:glyoxylase-like metal-dependent hydrolase (beta-lactamase superfamily II)